MQVRILVFFLNGKYKIKQILLAAWAHNKCSRPSGHFGIIFVKTQGASLQT